MSALSEFKQLVRELLADDERRKQSFLRDSCPLLGYARLCQREGTLPKLAAYLRENAEWQEFRKRWADAALLDARCQVIWAGADPLEEDLGKAIKAYASAWGYFPSDVVQNASALDPPRFNHLPDARTIELFRSFASPNRFGPFHPGLHVVGESYAAIFGETGLSVFKPDVTTWILLVAKIDDGSGGYAGRLELQKVARGCGALYPDPNCGAYLRTDKKFQDGLENAWWAVIGQNLHRDKIDFDVRWRLWVPDKNDEPLDYGLTGHSAEAGVACALMALCGNEPLDDHVAITAQFKEPGTINTRLMPVGEVAVKLLAPGCVSELQKMPLFEVVVHRDQEANGERLFPKQEASGKKTQPIKSLGEHLQVTAVTDLDEAYDRLSRWARLTREVKKGKKGKEGLAEGAKKALDDWCGEDQYRRSHFLPERAPDEMAREALGLHAKGRWGDRLTEEEEKKLELGDSADRVLILGDSGMGKTAFLMNCEWKIAAADDDRVPLRVPKLSSRAWENPDAVTSDLSSRFKDWVPEDELRPWFDHLRRSGNLVILLDALDQTSKRWEELNNWLRETGRVDACHVVMTGRFSVERGEKSVATKGIKWSVLRVEEFDEQQRKEYLGDELYKQLVMQQQDSMQDRRRKLQWAKLLGAPLLLKFIRRIGSSGELKHLPNKYCIYKGALKALLDQGIESAKHTGLSLGKLAQPGRRDKQLGQMAWHMVQSGNFTGFVEDEAFEGLCDDLQLDDFLDVLAQLNVVDVDISGTLGWRHLSFCEYFAGVHLATVLTRQQQTEHIENVMRLPLPEEGETRKRSTPVLRRNERWDPAPGFADPARWDPIFEFALSCAQQRNDEETLNGLANDLFRCGGIRVLRDFVHVESDPDPEKPQVADPLRELCRVLGGYSIDWRRDIDPLIVNRSGDDSTLQEALKMYRERADTVQTQDVTLDATALRMLEQLFQERQYRRSEYLAAAWHLLQERKENEPDVENCFEQIRAILAEERTGLKEKLPVVEEFLGTFRPCPKRDGDKLEFTIGEEGEADAPPTSATVQPFTLADFPVTNAVFEAFDPSHVRDRDTWSCADDQPAVWVNWYQARMFCAWLSAGGQDRFRLPTEVEWEYACRTNAERRTKYWWDDEFDAKQCNAANTLGRTNGRREKLGEESDPEAHKNAWDLYDMLGNVWEWCEDWYDKNYYRKLAAWAETRDGDPPEPVAGSSRVLRGGSWSADASYCRSASRRGSPPSLHDGTLGFRVCVSSSCLRPSRPPSD